MSRCQTKLEFLGTVLTVILPCQLCQARGRNLKALGLKLGILPKLEDWTDRRKLSWCCRKS